MNLHGSFISFSFPEPSGRVSSSLTICCALLNVDLCQVTSQKGVCLYARTAGGWGGGRSPAGSSGGADLAPSEGHVTRQDKALSTWAETWLAKKLKGPAFLAWLFNALFHCFRLCFPAGLAQEGNLPLLHHCTLEQSEHFFLKNLLDKMAFSCNQSLDGSFPPSPAEDRGFKRLSWGRVLHKLAELKGIDQRSPVDHPCSRSETGECWNLYSPEAPFFF